MLSKADCLEVTLCWLFCENLIGGYIANLMHHYRYKKILNGKGNFFLIFIKGFFFIQTWMLSFVSQSLSKSMTRKKKHFTTF